jgi:cytochrome c-type biogenesis protein
VQSEKPIAFAMHQLNVLTAFLAGLVSFVSPCVLPLVPSYLSFLTGTSLEDLKAETSAQAKARVFAHALAFVAGFTLIFVLIGLSASAIGGVFENNKRLVEILGGIVIVVLGLQMMGVLRIPALMMDKRVHSRPRKQSLWVSFLVGLGFAAGWSPCIGPILSAIILLASQEKIPQATFLLFVYSMGLAIPFLVTAAAITQSLGALGRIKRFLPAIERTSGAILVATGLVVAFDQFTRVAGFFYQYVKPPSL